MEQNQIAVILLYISLGTLIVRAVMRMVLALTYKKRNHGAPLSDEQRRRIRKSILPVGIIGLILALVAFVLMVV
ncbi:MAG: hypothetical protein K2M07_07525 [Muribaculaceae bacterium]|nr:hypothetical protein [Muribaculaceae bacterium]